MNRSYVSVQYISKRGTGSPNGICGNCLIENDISGRDEVGNEEGEEGSEIDIQYEVSLD
jgi:hypothetical protein